jgi:hypothetical protein
MDAGYISAMAALAGAAIGGLTTFATSWMTQYVQVKAQRIAHEREKREALFGHFLEEAAKLYSDAMQNKREDATALINIYALANRIRLISSPRVIESADMLTRVIIDTYLAPNVTMEGVRARWIEGGVDPLRDFGEACREELGMIGKG